MKQLLNTIYVSQQDVYIGLKGKNVNILKEGESIGKVPLHNIEGICTFGRQGASPALMAACMEENISLSFFSNSGRLRGRVIGMTNGNVTLRKEQYRLSDNEEKSKTIAVNMIIGKLYNCEQVLKRISRDHALRIDVPKVQKVTNQLKFFRGEVLNCSNLEQLRGIEGKAASLYFHVFDECILQNKEDFYLKIRSRRPPTDRVNALLSFAYSLLSAEVGAALEGAGLDAYVGFMHRDRPGRMSLALDMMEELRPIIADKFVLKIINRKQIKKTDFIVKENNAVLLKDDARRNFLRMWQEEKDEIITHPYLKEKIEKGLIPHVQTTTIEGAKRLRNVAKKCEEYGVRVQNSVFECIVDSTKLRKLELELKTIINPKYDSLRIYNLGKNHDKKVKHIGAKEALKVNKPLIF